MYLSGNQLIQNMKPLLYSLVLCVLFGCTTKKKKEKDYLLKRLTSNVTGVDFKNNVTDDIDNNIIKYIYFYNGAGVSVGDINNDGLPDLFFVSNKEDNKLFLNKGGMRFEDITDIAGVKGMSDWQTGTTMVDVNGDGYLDIYICAVSGLLALEGSNELYINNGDNTFTEKSKEYGLNYKGYSTQSYFFDYDKDGDLDLYLVNHAVHTKTSHGPAMLREKRTDLTGDVLFKNDNGRFKDVSLEANIFGGVNGYGLSASIADFNNDGWDDIYVCNDFHEDDYYYLNNGDGTFKESLKTNFSMISRFSMGNDVADLNQDGWLDIMTLDMLPKDERVLKETEGDDAMLNVSDKLRKLGYQDQYARNMLQINQKSNFREEALYNGIADTDWSWAPLFADFDNDGRQDLFVANGILKRPNDLDFRKYVSSNFRFKDKKQSADEWLLASLKEMPNGAYPNQIFKSTKDKFVGKNKDWIEDVPSVSNGAVYADLDLDGDLDLITNNMNSESYIYENAGNNKNYLNLKFKYKDKNLNGLGVKAYVYSKGKKQFKQLYSSRGFMSSVSYDLHFGLDTINNVDSLKIIWPNNKITMLHNIEANKNIELDYSKLNTERSLQNDYNDDVKFRKTNLIDYCHKEDGYNDFHNERLIPYKVSMSGPAIAIGDIDGNGYEDVFLGGASEGRSSVYMNNGTSFEKKNFKFIEDSFLSEDTAATLFDADGDGDLDLYIGSGINKMRMKFAEKDRLYFYENNEFVEKKNIPENLMNTSCVIPYDYDGDGDLDLFVGNRSNPSAFGEKVNSYILENTGAGVFTINKRFKLNSMVTNAVWKDVNSDGIKDLLVATEWDTPKLYINNRKELKLVAFDLDENKGLNGLWQAVQVFDVDKDGDEDILLGNWGLNTKFTATVQAPLKMYFSDFDKNGKTETVLAYNKQGNYYPIHSKDELSSQLTMIKKRFVNYKDYALKTVEEIFTNEELEKAKVFTIDNLASGYIENNNGVFNKFHEFDKNLQLASINTFGEPNTLGQKGLFVYGNNKMVNTYHGAYESLKGYVLENKNKNLLATELGIVGISSQVKDVREVALKKEKLLLIISNNDSIKVYRKNNTNE